VCHPTRGTSDGRKYRIFFTSPRNRTQEADGSIPFVPRYCLGIALPHAVTVILTLHASKQAPIAVLDGLPPQLSGFALDVANTPLLNSEQLRLLAVAASYDPKQSAARVFPRVASIACCHVRASKKADTRARRASDGTILPSASKARIHIRRATAEIAALPSAGRGVPSIADPFGSSLHGGECHGTGQRTHRHT
jgi:hypothetical protein